MRQTREQRAAELTAIRTEYDCSQNTPLDEFIAIFSGIVGHWDNFENGLFDAIGLVRRFDARRAMPLAIELLPHLKYDWEGNKIIDG